MKEYADKLRWSKPFCKGTKALLSTKNLRVDLHLPSKVQRQWIGHYKVSKVTAPLAYRLNLPPAWQIHPVFHINNLKRLNLSTEFVWVEGPPSPIVTEGEEEYDVKGILRHTIKGASHWYLVL